MTRAMGVLCLALSTGTVAFAEEPKATAQKEATAEEFLRAYPEAAREAGEFLVRKYGQPDEKTASMLIWYTNGPWKRTILYKEEVKHNFPKAHVDVVEQFVDHKVPADMLDDLYRFDGSLYVDRTKGEISSRCEREEMNFLALNLAHDILTGKRTVDDARQYYANTAAAFEAGQLDNPYLKGLTFTPDRVAADPDQVFKPGT